MYAAPIAQPLEVAGIALGAEQLPRDGLVNCGAVAGGELGQRLYDGLVG